MKILVPLLILLFAAACASTVEPGQPVITQAPDQQIAPQAAASPTIPSGPVGNCQSKILGRVLDANNNFVKGAAVELRGAAVKGTPPRTMTDDNGLYGFAGLCGGAYAFTVTPPGKKAQALATNVAVDGGNAIKIDLSVK